MADIQHVTPLAAAAGQRRHRRHRVAITAGVVAGLTMMILGLATITEIVFWAGFIIAAGTVIAGQHWCSRHDCRVLGRKP